MSVKNCVKLTVDMPVILYIDVKATLAEDYTAEELQALVCSIAEEIANNRLKNADIVCDASKIEIVSKNIVPVPDENLFDRDALHDGGFLPINLEIAQKLLEQHYTVICEEVDDNGEIVDIWGIKDLDNLPDNYMLYIESDVWVE